MRRIAVAGFQHETNTFAPRQAGRSEFQMADSWPPMLVGHEVESGTCGLNLPIAGAIAAATLLDIEIEPILWCAAEPSGPVTDDAFDWICDLILQGLRHAGNVDGVYLDLHGAMVTESHDDGEGELLHRLRSEFGSEIPIGVSLDLHANISPAFVEAANVTTIYRTYPHLDMAETGSRCMRRLHQFLDGERLVPAFRQGSFLVPLHAQCTDEDPSRALYSEVAALDSGTGSYCELALGFTASDVHDCGPAIVAYGESKSDAQALADQMMTELSRSETQFDRELLGPEQAVAIAMEAAKGRPVVLADVQDNPGAGGTSDTTGMLRALQKAGVNGTLIGVLHDPEFARLAHETGLEGIVEADLGGNSGILGDRPFQGRFKIEALSDGAIEYMGEMYGGGIAQCGPSCLVTLLDDKSEIRIIVSSSRIQCLDRALFIDFGADPEEASIICVKSTVHFRADFEPISAQIINVAAPGAFPCQLEVLPFQHLRGGVRKSAATSK